MMGGTATVASRRTSATYDGIEDPARDAEVSPLNCRLRPRRTDASATRGPAVPLALSLSLSLPLLSDEEHSVAARAAGPNIDESRGAGRRSRRARLFSAPRSLAHLSGCLLISDTMINDVISVGMSRGWVKLEGNVRGREYRQIKDPRLRRRVDYALMPFAVSFSPVSPYTQLASQISEGISRTEGRLGDG